MNYINNFTKFKNLILTNTFWAEAWSISLLELQAEELEGRLTEENLRRLEIGKKPAKSPLLDRLKAEIEGGQ